MDPKKTFAERLLELKSIRGLTNTDIAKACKIDKSNMTRYCKGEYKAKQDIIYRIAETYGIDPAWLMGYDVPMYTTGSSSNQVIANVVPLTKEEEYFLSKFRMLTEDQRIGIFAQIEALANLKGGK